MKWFWKHISVFVGIAISGALLFLALRDVHPTEVAHAISQARTVWLIPMGAVLMSDLWIRALRWRILLSPAVPRSPAATVWQLAKLEAIGLAINNVLFLRIGELARAYLAGY